MKKIDFHNLEAQKSLEFLETNEQGLAPDEAQGRLIKFGHNLFPQKKSLRWWQILLHQFASPLIYILLLAAIVALILGDLVDAGFILLVLALNALIGTLQEHSAQKSSLALRRLAQTKTLVRREGKTIEVSAEDLVPGDVVVLETGRKVPADLRLLQQNSLEIDESLLTGESLPVFKDSTCLCDAGAVVGDRKNMAHMGTLVTKGRGTGVVTATGLRTQLGKIAHSLNADTASKPPLLIRMERFTKKIAIFLSLLSLAMALYLLWQNWPWHDVLIFTVALAVSAIPEGLPVALTVALAVASRRMAKRNVIVAKLPAVEALGSCTYIATDKTGTLTVNQLTVTEIALPQDSGIKVSGSGFDNGKIETQRPRTSFDAIVRCGAWCNEARLIEDGAVLDAMGDAVDVALLVLARKHGTFEAAPAPTQEIPFEPELQFAATLHALSYQEVLISIKGALERLLPLCDRMSTPAGIMPVNPAAIIQQAEEMAERGLRVLALAGARRQSGDLRLKEELHGLEFYGLVGMIDPLRPEAKEAVHACHKAGIKVAMVTGDHPITALAISRQLSLASDMAEVVTGAQLRLLSDPEAQEKIASARVFARMDPQQKLQIVQGLIARGEFVAVTGDGANDAPALKAAHVGIAMGKSGTDVAKETASLILTDDRFASIVAGIEEGRIAYANVRKVVYLLISTGLAEILMFALSLAVGTPMPLTAAQILWLNLVTNGIQDIGLAFEAGEGTELLQPPRSPKEPIFNRIMLERILLSAGVMGTVSFGQFYQLQSRGVALAESQNITLLLLVLFENIMIGNCRSETRSGFLISPFQNKILFFGTVAALGLHVFAMYNPLLGRVLGVAPVPWSLWPELALQALAVFLVMEVYKRLRH